MRTAFYAAKIRDPYVELDPREIAMNDNGETAYRDIVGINHENPKDRDYAEQMLAEAHELLNETSGIDRHIRDELFATELKTAILIAEKHDISISEIYSNDELYGQLMRGSYSPQDYARLHLDEINALNEDFMNQLALKLMDAEEEATGESFDAMFFQLNPLIQSNVKRLAEIYQEVARQVFVCKFGRYWGPAGWNLIAIDHQAALLPKLPLTPTIDREINNF